MFFYLSKILQPLLWPFNLALLALAASFVFYHYGKPKHARALTAAAFLFLLLPSIPIFSHVLLRSLESDYPTLRSSETPTADAIVVLGGSIYMTIDPRLEAEEGGGSRLVPAARLFRAKKAPLVVVSSGVPYTLPDGTKRTDGMDMKEFLIDQGVPKAAIELEGKSRNTDENALYTEEILRKRGAKKVILVTSAFHMARAMAMFKKYGVDSIIPFPTDKRITDDLDWKDFLPDLASMELTTMAIKEYVGRWIFILK